MNVPEVIIPTVVGTPFGGGLYAGRFFISAQAYGLIVAAAENGEIDEIKWGDNKKVAGALSYNDGLANTQAMAESGSALAKQVLTAHIGRHDDWYLPSRLEALIMFAELADKGGFEQDWYWTSTQYAGGDASAWYQSFSTGRQDFNLKHGQLRARAVRRLIL